MTKALFGKMKMGRMEAKEENLAFPLVKRIEEIVFPSFFFLVTPSHTLLLL